MPDNQPQFWHRTARRRDLLSSTAHYLGLEVFRLALVGDERTAQFNKCQRHQLLSKVLSRIVVQVRTAPAVRSATATLLAVVASARAIMLPPRPPPESFAPSAPPSRAAPTSVFSSGEDTVNRLSK